MTLKLFLDQPYQTAFEAAVVSSRRVDGDIGEVVLEQTLFYPESGGQLPDTGTLGGAVVIDVQETAQGGVAHTLRGELPAGPRAAGAIDWACRFDHMQQHSGQHVLSRAFIQSAGLHTVSFHMGDEACTIDLEGAGFDDSAARGAEDLANQVIAENRPVDISTLPVAELDGLDLRRKVPEGVSEARIVSVRDFDMTPCCGTHVRSTGELGMVKILKSEKVRGRERVHFKVGLRALDDYREKHAILQAIANRLTTAPGDLVPRMDRMLADVQSGAKRARALVERLVLAEKGAIVEKATRVGRARLVACRDDDASYVRALATALQAEAGVVAIVGAADGTVLCVASRDLDVDVASGAAEIARELGGSGGGKGSFVQLKLPDGAQVEELMRRMDRHVRNRLA